MAARMWGEISGIAHNCIALFVFSYGVLFRKNPGDWAFLIVSLIILIHWTLLNGECLVSYVHKSNEDPEYIAGSEVFNSKDMYVLGIPEEVIRYIMGAFVFVWAASIYFVMQRNGFPLSLIILFLFFFFVYNGSLRWFDKHYENPSFHIVQHACLISFVVVSVFVVQRLWRITRRR
jgi:hypothetical protein